MAPASTTEDRLVRLTAFLGFESNLFIQGRGFVVLDIQLFWKDFSKRARPSP